MSIHALTEKAMVLTLSMGLWQGYRLDKQASQEITSAKGANADAARVNKHLVPKDALAKVVTATGAVRTHFYTHTMPWRDNGDRLMPRAKFTAFIEEHEKLVADFQAEVEEFITVRYPLAIEQAEFRMGALFDRDDYPAAFELRRKFYVNLDINPVTTVDDFRVEIDAEHTDKVRAIMEKAAEKRVQTAMGDVWARLADTVGYLAERLDATTPEGGPAVIRETTLQKLDELVDLIPGLNVLDDPHIEQARRMVKDKLTGIDVKGVRKDPAYRAELAGEAKQIVDTMAGFMRAFGVKQEELA